LKKRSKKPAQPCSDLIRVSTRQPQGLCELVALQQTFRALNRVDARIKSGHGRKAVRPVFCFFFSKKKAFLP